MVNLHFTAPEISTICLFQHVLQMKYLLILILSSGEIHNT